MWQHSRTGPIGHWHCHMVMPLAYQVSWLLTAAPSCPIRLQAVTQCDSPSQTLHYVPSDVTAAVSLAVWLYSPAPTPQDKFNPPEDAAHLLRGLFLTFFSGIHGYTMFMQIHTHTHTYKTQVCVRKRDCGRMYICTQRFCSG